MRKAILAVALAVMVALPLQAADWDIDAPHSSITFKVSHLVISTTTGTFDSFTGDINFDPDNLKQGAAKLTIQVESIDTENEDRDKHLKSPDFFDVGKYPTITFESKKVIPGEGKNFQLVGDLTIKGTTKEVTFDCEYRGTVEFMGTVKSGFTCQTTINRQDFGITWSQALETGGLVVGDEVEITLELELNKAG